jgi:hypothetical protein
MKVISVDLKDVPFGTALEAISQKGDFQLNYNRNRIPVDEKVSVKMEKVRALDALVSVLTMTGTELSVTSEGQLVVVPSGNRSVRMGAVKGRVLDVETKAPLVGANVVFVGGTMGAVADIDGKFAIVRVPVGSYTMRMTYLGYEPTSKTDVIVRSNRTTFVEAEMPPSMLLGKTVSVTAGYFSSPNDQSLRTVQFSSEEIRRAPGSAGDVSRIIAGLPSIAKVNDQSNSIIVRGGSPVENGFFIDNIEIPNINHFPEQGSTGGPIGLVNVDFIRDVRFSSGGFSAKYGDRLSSIMDLSFREGDRDRFNGQLDLNFGGFGGIFEGPVFGKKGSLLFSARRSFLDLLVEAIGTGVAPRYSDYQGKLIYDINPKHQITALGVLGVDRIGQTKAQAEDFELQVYGFSNISEGTAGANWRALWNKNGYSNTSLTWTSTRFRYDYIDTRSDVLLLRNRSLERTLKLRNVNYFRLNPAHSLEFGFEMKRLMPEYDNYFADFTSALGDTVPSLTMNQNPQSNTAGVFLNHIFKPSGRFSTNLGLRADYYTYSKNRYLSPRFSFSWRFSERTALNGSTGIFIQNLPLILLMQTGAFKNLKDPKAVHYVLGIEHLITESTRLTIEAYQKDYSHFPVDPAQPSLFVMDEMFYRFGFFFNHERLTDGGKAQSRGIEVMVQKRLAERFYGLASASYFRTRYCGVDGVWRNRIFDNRVIFSIEGGYKPNRKWEFSLRWIYAGGAPYTPFDVEKSRTIKREVLDENRINQSWYPDYHSLNIRFDRRFNFYRTNLIFYFSIWNAYNRKNVANYCWNEFKNQQEVLYQWGLLPIFGLEYEF